MKLYFEVIIFVGLAFVSYSKADDQVGFDEDICKERRQEYLDMTINSRSRNPYTELVRLKCGVKPNEDVIRSGGLRNLKERRDAADFRLPAILNILYGYSDCNLLSKSFVAEAKETILNFKYWPDELEDWKWEKTPQMDSGYIFGLLNDDDPTNDSIALSHQAAFDKIDKIDDMCYWSENHYILFSSGGYLAGQLYPEEVFSASGQSGKEKMERFRPRVMKWLELRYKSGFSEWLSNVYYNEDMPALLALVELCEDQEIVVLATMVLDLMMADMALNSYRGSFSCSHGRTYENKMSGYKDHTRGISNLMFGMNKPNVGNMSASLLAVSEKYRLPHVLYEIANDVDRDEFINMQRIGITIDDDTLSKWGLDTRSIAKGCNLENGMSFLTLEAYCHPLTIELFRDMLNEYDLWGNKFFAPFKEYRLIIEHPELFDEVSGMSTGVKSLGELAQLGEKDITRNMRPEVNVYTYRRSEYMLSTAQDYRGGYGGDQQSIWQATLGAEAVCFTTHPAKMGDSSAATPNYWTGYGTLPRAIQVKNVVISLYDVDTTTDLYVKEQLLLTHAYLPSGKFDETAREKVDNGVWFFARKGEGLVALFCCDKNADWKKNSDDSDKGGAYEIIANGEKTIWICELGRFSDGYSNLLSFKKAILSAPLNVDAGGLTVKYKSPSQGILAMDWDGVLTQNGIPVNTKDYKRYDNPYTVADFPGDKIEFRFKGNSLSLDFEKMIRRVCNTETNKIVQTSN